MSDLIGKKFGKWTILEIIGRHNGQFKVKCSCECQSIYIRALYELKNGRSNMCRNCAHKERYPQVYENIINKRFGSRVVIGESKNKRGKQIYLCICDCGFKGEVSGTILRQGRSYSCERCCQKTHGLSKTNTYSIWIGMIKRCSKENAANYKNYGGRGIKVCERWLEFENFISDMGKRPEGFQIDRINNDDDYKPENCRWVSPKENSNNRRDTPKNYINTQHYKWTILRDAGTYKDGAKLIVARCETCRQEKIRRLTALINGKSKQCTSCSTIFMNKSRSKNKFI